MSSSESDKWNGLPNLPWPTISHSMPQNNPIASTQIHSRSNDRPDSSYFSLSKSGPSSSGVTSKSFLNGGSSPPTDSVGFGGLSGFKNGESRCQMNSSFGSAMGSGFQMTPGRPPTVDTPGSDDVVGSMGMPPLNHSASDTLAQSTRPPGYTSQLSRSPGTTFASHRPPHSTHTSFHSDNQGFDSMYGGVDLSAGLGKIQLGDAVFQERQRSPYKTSASSYDVSLNRLKSQVDDLNYPTGYEPQADPLFAYNANRPQVESTRPSITPAPADYSRINSPFFSVIDNPPLQYRNANRLSDEPAVTLDRKLRGFQHEPDYPIQPATTRLTYPQAAYDLAGYQAARLNALSSFYIPQLGAAAFGGRSYRDHDPNQVVRSPLLEEFRANSKGNKRYELKVCIENCVLWLMY